MFQTITDITTGPTCLQQPIGNRDGGLKIGLRSVTYTIGWYNITGDQFVTSPDKITHIPPGLWSLRQLQDHLAQTNSGLSLNVDPKTGMAVPKVLNQADFVRVPKGLQDLLGFVKYRETFTSAKDDLGDRPMDLCLIKQLFVHLDELNTAKNALNGAPSSLLAVAAIGNLPYGDIITSVFPNPEFKLLRYGTISELTLSVRYERGNSIDNHGYQ